MNDDEFQKALFLSSVPLARLNKQREPTDFASGGLIDYCGKRLLLTVSHATGDQKEWAVQLRYVPDKGLETYGLEAMHFIAKGSLASPKAGLEDVDFSYVEVPATLRAFRQEIVPPADVVNELPITVHTPNLTDLPKPGDKFGFCGMVMPSLEHHFGKAYAFGELRVYPGLSYLRTEGDYHYFSLPFNHPGHEHFKGCSGAPILSVKGFLVGLVCGGCITTNEVWGISLRAYKTPIDILVGNVR